MQSNDEIRPHITIK